ncbi:fatty acid desaturase [Shimia sp. SDUM112013]|uniref:fatty acid desaturase n=1 Tax=Shimia sp. SDUM112013 TaxID=3136160 RepID=UPI0032EDBEC8
MSMEPTKSAKQGISVQSRRHNEMRKEALRAHPELHALAGTEPRTALALPVLLALQWGMAWLVSDGGVLVVGLTAFLIGQLVYHSAASLIHETCHKLVFRGDRAKLAFDLGLEVILTSYGKQLIYQHQHVTSHHPYVGDYERDYEHEDICALQARQYVRRTHPALQRGLTILTLILHSLPLGFMLGDYILPRLYALASGRPVQDPVPRFGGTAPSLSDMAPFILVSALSNLTLFLLLGPWALLYHIWSLSFFLGKMGISNLGQSLSEHPGTDDINPTRSTYGPINWLLFNTGYHNEHHSFPNVPWTRLSALHTGAPEVFHAEAEKSYFGCWWDHVRRDFTASRDLKLHEHDQSAHCEGREKGWAR